LSGIAFTADAARNSLEDPGAVDALLRTVRAEASAAVGEIRRLVYGMRPPALDELGLVGALRQWALQMRTADGRPLAVDVRAPDPLRELPASVEVAAYRIAVEALTNAARHSGSDHAALEIGLDDEQLTLEVRDFGRDATAWHAGVGMASMAERAAEIGGTVHASPTPDGGRVTARLPLP
jgi:signal transduction histidine kinase